MEKPNYYAIIPAPVRYDKELVPMARILYSEITALCDKQGFCWATNKYFADLYSVSDRTIREWLNVLKNKNYINIDIIYKENSKEIDMRRISIGMEKNFQGGMEKNFQENNINNNIKENNINIIQEKTNNSSNVSSSLEKVNPSVKPKRETFRRPTIDEIREYCDSRNNGIDAERFFDFYESKGWKVGNTPMKDWKACVRTWEKKNGTIVPKVETITIENKLYED